MPTRLDELFWELRARTDQLDRDIRQGQRKMRSAGEKSADEFLAGLEQRLARRRADINEALARRLINPRQARQQAVEAAQEFDAAILRRIERLARSGRLTDDEFVRLAGSLKNVRQEGELAFDRIQRGLRSLLAGAGIVAAINLMGRMVRGVRELAQAVTAFADRAGRVREIRTSFENLAASAGVSAPRALERMRDAAAGTISRFELMQRANLAFQARLPLTAERLGELVEVSRRLGETIGRDATEAFTRLVNGIAKGEQNLLEELGLLTRMEDALRAWEQQTGRNSDSLDQQQKILIFYNAVLDEARQKLAAAGAEAESPRRALDRVRALWVDLRDAITVAVAESPRIERLFRTMGESAQGAGERLEDIADRIGAFVDAFLELKATDFGIIATEVQFLGKAIAFLGRAIASATGLGDLGPRFRQLQEDALERRRADRRSRELIQEIRASQDLATLERLRETTKRAIAASEGEIQRLRAQGIEENDREIQKLLDQLSRLDEELSAIEVRIRELRQPRRSGGDEPDAETLRRREQLMRQLADQLAGLTATAVDEALLQLERLEREFDEAFGGRIPAAVRAGLDRIRQSIESDRRLEELRRQLGTFEVSIPTETVKAALEEFIAELINERDAMQEGSVERERYNALLQEAGRLYEQVTKEVRDLAEEEKKRDEEREKREKREREQREREERERIRNLRDQARTLEENARAAIQLAEAFGLINSEAAEVLETVAQLGAAVARIAGGDMSAIPSALAAVASLFSGGGELRVDRALLDALERNRQAIEENTRALGGDRRAGEITAGLAAQREVFEVIDRAFRKVNIDAIRRELRRALQDPEFVERVRELSAATGIDVIGAMVDFAEGGDINEFIAAWNAANRILHDSAAAFGGIADSNVAAQMERFRAEVELLDLDTPREQLEAFLAVLDRIGAGDFANRIRRMIAAGDIEGAREIIRETFRRLRSGELTAAQVEAMFGPGVTASDVERILLDLNALLESLAEEGGDVQDEGFQVTRGIKEIQANRLIAQGETHSILLGGILDEAAAIHDLFLRLIESTVQVQPPELPPFAPPRSITVQAPISQLIGTVEVQAVGGAVDEGSLRRAVQAAAFDLVEHIDRALERRRVAEQRARGR